MQFDNYSIKPLREEDLQAYFQLIDTNRKRLEDFFTGTVARTQTLEDTRVFLAEIVQKAKDKTYFPFIIVNNTSGKIIGFLDLKNIDWSIPKSEIGCYMDEDHAGKGVASKALTEFCNFCFAEFKFKKLFLRTHPGNASARRIAEKCGFEIEGTIRRDYKTTSGEVVDLVYYGKLN